MVRALRYYPRGRQAVNWIAAYVQTGKSQLDAEVELLRALDRRSYYLFDTQGSNIGSIDPHDGVGYFSFSIPHKDDLRISTFEEELSV